MASHIIELFRACLLTLVLLPCIARAEVTLKILEPDTVVKSEGLIPFRVELQNPSNRIEEGRLETSATDPNGYVYWTHRGQELVIQPGNQRYELVLPSVSSAGAVTLSFSWLTAAGMKPLDSASLTPAYQEKLALCVRSAFYTPQTENALVGNVADKSLRKRFTTTDELHTDPLTFSAYDAVAFEAAAFRGARGKALTAIAQWVDSGGSVFIIADGVMEEPQREFLSRISKDSGKDVISFSESGEITNLPMYFRCGRGEVLMVQPSAASTFHDPERWTKSQTTNWQSGTPLESKASLGAFTQLLIPETPKPLSISAILGIMLCFIVVVAPGDYLVLGRLKRHRWTWRLFALAACGFTWWMVHFANARMSEFEQSGSMITVDVGKDGRVLSTESITLTLPTRTSVKTHTEPYGIHFPSAYYMVRSAGVRYEGNLLGTHTIAENMQQWTPHFRRTRSIGRGEFADTSDAKPINLMTPKTAIRALPFSFGNPLWSRDPTRYSGMEIVGKKVGSNYIFYRIHQ